MTAKTQKRALAAWLLACPLLLIAAIGVLPRFDHFYGSPAEGYTLVALMALPIGGAVGVFRHVRASPGVRLAIAACYLVVCFVLALFTVIFIGCSWAGACF